MCYNVQFWVISFKIFEIGSRECLEVFESLNKTQCETLRNLEVLLFYFLNLKLRKKIYLGTLRAGCSKEILLIRF